MTDEDEEFNRIEREAGMRKEIVKEHMTQDEIIEMAIQGHASTRDAIRWAIKQALAAPVQEPVGSEFLQAITDPENQPSQFGTVTLEYHFEKIKKWEELFERMSNKVLAQRQWVGLTDEEMAEIWENGGWYVTMFKAIEAKLKEKNA